MAGPGEVSSLFRVLLLTRFVLCLQQQRCCPRGVARRLARLNGCDLRHCIVRACSSCATASLIFSFVNRPCTCKCSLLPCVQLSRVSSDSKTLIESPLCDKLVPRFRAQLVRARELHDRQARVFPHVNRFMYIHVHVNRRWGAHRITRWIASAAPSSLIYLTKS